MIEVYECTNCGALLSASRTHKFCGGLYPRSDMDLGLNLMAKRARRKLAAHLRLDEEMNGTRTQKKRPSSMRRRFLQLAKRDGLECRSCGTDQDLTVDHIVPLSRGGSNRLENLQILCESCNGLKGSKTMAEWKA